MPKLRQPVKLERLALKTATNWLLRTTELLLPIILKMSKHDPQEAADYLKTVVDHFHFLFEKNVPWEMYDEMNSDLFVQLTDLVERIPEMMVLTTSMVTYLNHLNVVGSVSSVLVSRKLRKLEIEEMPEVIRRNFFVNLPTLTGIKYLDLGRMSARSNILGMRKIVVGAIKFMPLLSSFNLVVDCTNDILRALLKYCPKLRQIDISRSKYVTNTSLEILAKFENLNKVEIFYCPITVAGMTKFILTAPNLMDLGNYSELDKCFNQIYPKRADIPNLRLKTFSNFRATTKHLELIAQKCPDMDTINIGKKMPVDFVELINVQKLTDLSLSSAHFFGDRFQFILSVRGSNLTSLDLCWIEDVEMPALISISQSCPNLKKLRLTCCLQVTPDTIRCKTNNLRVTPFMNLEILIVESFCQPYQLEFMLFTALKIKSVSLYEIAETNDAIFDRILRKNPLQHLELLCLHWSDKLTMSKVHMLIEKCPNLTKLSGIKMWKDITDADIAELRQFVKEKNIDLRIYERRINDK